MDFYECKSTYIYQLHKMITKCSLKKNAFERNFFVSDSINAVTLA